MPDAPTTRPSLLVRLRDADDREAWREFVRAYAPVVYGYARRRGLQEADAADLTQEVMRAVAESAGRLDYDRGRGRFRGWLFTIAHHKLHDFLARRRRQCPGSGDTDVQRRLEEQPEPDGAAALWDEEYQRRLFAWAAERVRADCTPATWQAFWRTAVEGQSGRDVADELGMTVAAVYLAKSRVLARLRDLIRQTEGDE